MGDVIIHPDDTVKVNLDNGHKYAVRDIKKGEAVIKYGFSIGIAKQDIKAGEHVHTHNLKTALSGEKEYTYAPDKAVQNKETPITISAFKRQNGDIGIRNDIWIIPTVGCVNGIANSLSQKNRCLCISPPLRVQSAW